MEIFISAAKKSWLCWMEISISAAKKLHFYQWIFLPILISFLTTRKSYFCHMEISFLATYISFRMEISFLASKKSYILPNRNISLSLSEKYFRLWEIAVFGHLPSSFALRKSTSITWPPPKRQRIISDSSHSHFQEGNHPKWKCSKNSNHKKGWSVIEGTLCMSPIWGLALAKREESVVVNSQTVPYSHYILSISSYITIKLNIGTQ